MNAITPNETKYFASRVPRGQHKDWHSIKCQVMKWILRAKSDYSPLYSSLYPGNNKPGHVLEQLRNGLIKEDMTSQLLDPTNTKYQIYVSQSGNSSDDSVAQQYLPVLKTPPVDMHEDNCDLKTQGDQLIPPSTSARDPMPTLALQLNDETLTSPSPLTNKRLLRTQYILK